MFMLIIIIIYYKCTFTTKKSIISIKIRMFNVKEKDKKEEKNIRATKMLHLKLINFFFQLKIKNPELDRNLTWHIIISRR